METRMTSGYRKIESQPRLIPCEFPKYEDTVKPVERESHGIWVDLVDEFIASGEFCSMVIPGDGRVDVGVVASLNNAVRRRGVFPHTVKLARRDGCIYLVRQDMLP